MKKKNKIQNALGITGIILIIISWILHTYPNILGSFIQTLQPEFGSGGIIVLMVWTVWKLTKIKIST